MPITLVGRVIKAGFMDKTVTVAVDRMVQHARTHKMIKRTSKLLIHDQKNVLRTEDLVRIRSCQKKSRRKHFELDVVIKRGWAGQEFDRMHPRKAATTLTNQAELEASVREQAELQQSTETSPLPNEKPSGDGTEASNRRQASVDKAAAAGPEVAGTLGRDQ